MDMRVTVLLLLISCTLFVWHAASQTQPPCPLRWFGSSCQFKCRCGDNQCATDGSCTQGGACQSGWFGPACQYEDLVNRSTTLQGGISQRNDKTCSTPSSNVNKVRVTLDNRYHFTWLRVRLSQSDLVSRLRVNFRLNASLSCVNRRTTMVDETTLDVLCDVGEKVQHVVLSWEGIGHVCSMHISGGRNVALKQHATQSSSYSETSIYTNHRYMVYDATKAVDGNRNPDFSTGHTCSHTASDDRSPNLNVTFSLLQHVTRYVLYNRANSLEGRLQRFELRSFSESLTQVLHYKDKTTDPASVYTVIPDLVSSPIRLVNVAANKNGQDHILTLCELEIYGDSACKPGQYGRECNHTCNCAGGGACFVSTGGCPAGCAAGFRAEDCGTHCDPGSYGLGCKSSCSQFCVRGNGTRLCAHTDGACLHGCHSGYQGSTCTQQAKHVDDELVTVLVVAVVFCVAAVVVVVLVIMLFWRRHTRAAQTEALVVEDLHVETSKQGGPGLSGAGKQGGPGLSGAGQKIKSSFKQQKMKRNEEDSDVCSNSTYSNSRCENSSTVISVQQLAGFMASTDRAFFENQFMTLPGNRTATMTAALSPENKHKNRYKNICAYDHSRVHLLEAEGKDQGDYINASYVQGYTPDEKFIASQGPTATILEDFLRMLWEQEVDKVVMLTNLVEDGKQKCERYWPEDVDMTVGEMTVKLATTQVFADYTIRRLQLRKGREPLRSLIQFHFTAWPDKDIPTGPWGLVDFEQRVASYPTHKPVVVHCSAGVGRTGTFIALRNVMREAEETGRMDFFSTVQKLRQDRVNMVQTVDQYIFLHRAAQVAIVCMGTSVTLADAEKRMGAIEAKSKFGTTHLQQEFQAICSVCEDKQEGTVEAAPPSVYENSQNLLNRHKNRVADILPKEMYRPVLSCEGNNTSDYINAVLVPSFVKQNQEIITQLPMPATVPDLWRLVTQYKVTLIVAFETESKVTDRTVGDYLPSRDSGPTSLGQFRLRTEPETSAPHWLQETVYVTQQVDTNRKTDIPWCLTHLTCSTNLDPVSLLEVIQHVRALKTGTDGRTLYMCRNGAEYSGLVCVLSLLLDRMDNDHHLTIPLVVGAIKAIRPQVIPSLEQYSLLYKVLQLYSHSMNEYFNY